MAGAGFRHRAASRARRNSAGENQMNRIIPIFFHGVICVIRLHAKEKDKKNSGTIQRESLDQYLQRMQQNPILPTAPSIGSLWMDSGRLADLGSDYKARHVGDLITISVLQNITATNAGSVSSSRNLS